MIVSPADGPLAAILPYYRTGPNHIGQEFFRPCLSRCIACDRAAGYFSSSVLVSWADILPYLLQAEVRIRLLISPDLTPTDVATLKVIASVEDRAAFLVEHADSIVTEALGFAKNPKDVSQRHLLLAWLIAANQIELRFAVPAQNTSDSIFHDKSGIFRFPDGTRIGFAGSANETGAAYNRNTERLFVYKSWETAGARTVAELEKDFERMWDGDEGRLVVRPLSAATMSRIRTMCPLRRPELADDTENEAPKLPRDKPDKWAHQLQAAEAFEREGSGVLEMATGTGKTRTAQLIAAKLLADGNIDGFVLAVNGTDLLDQWSKTLLPWAQRLTPRLSVLRQYDKHYQAQTFALNPRGRILIISREQLPKLFHLLPATARSRLLIIHDEVHGLGAPAMRAETTGESAAFRFRLGLSATPEREYDAEGSRFIESEVGKVIYTFTTEDAIRNGILCEFDYVPLPYELTEEDRRRLKAVYSKKAARAQAGSPMSEEEVWMEIARVYKTAEQKPRVFASYLATNPTILSRSIIFVEEKSYGELILPIVAKYTHNYRTYYHEDDREELSRFSRNEIDCLVTCHRISQGIDIQNLRSVILFSSARSRLETIQRIGRVLRVDPKDANKRALVVDFVRTTIDAPEPTQSADSDRAAWLRQLSTTRRNTANGD